MKLHLSQNEIEKICYGFIDDVKTNGHQIVLTRGGNVAIILNRSAGYDYPLLGAYFTGTTHKTGEWLPMRWREDGRVNSDYSRLIDLILDDSELPTEAA